MMQHTINIWRREMLDIVRDRKSLRNALFMPIFMAAMFALLSAFFGNVGEAGEELDALEPMVVAAIGTQNLPDEVLTKLDALVLQLEPYEGSVEQLEADVRSGDVELGLIVPDDFMQNVEAGKPATPIILEMSGGSFSELGTENRLEVAFEQYGDEVLAKRLEALGVDSGLLTPVVIETRDVMLGDDSNRASRAGSLIAGFYIPLLLAVAIGSGGLSTAIDTTAGERDRGTLEALLLTPAGERGIFMGKTLKVLTMTLIPAALTVLTFILISRYVTPLIWADYRPLEISLDKVLLAIIITIPFMLIVGLFQMMLALRAKSVKDAQSVTSLSSLAVMLPMGAGAFMQPDNPLLHLIPGFGTASVISKMVIAQPFLSYLPYVLISTVVLAAIAVWFGARMFDRERLLYDG